MNEAPRPNYDYDVAKVAKAYEKALKDVQSEINSLFLTDFERAQVVAVEENIKNILSDVTKYGDEWATVAMNKSATEGIASTIYALGLAGTFEEALRIASFNKINKQMVAAAIADTQEDLLAMTQNIHRQSKLAIRRATAEAIRHQMTIGINSTQDISREIKNRILKATDVAITDSRGYKWKVEHYTKVITETKMMEARREAAINQALAEEAYYGRISRHGAKDACRHYEGMIVKLVSDAPGNYRYIGDLPRREIFHPCCKHMVTPTRIPNRE